VGGATCPSELFVAAWGVGALGVERSAVVNAPAHELRPVGHSGRSGLDLLGKQRPKLRVIPTKRMAGGVSVGTNHRAKFFDFANERVARKCV